VIYFEKYIISSFLQKKVFDKKQTVFMND